MSIADIIRIPFGYVLEWFYNLSGNYGLAMILFGVAVKLVMLPISMKSKKSMMKMSRIAPQAKALEEKYGNDKNKYQQELMKLYQREGVSTMGGCLWSFVPLLILIPLYQVIREPMVYMMHLSAEHAAQIVEVIARHVELPANDYYHQLAAASYMADYLPEIRAAIPALANVELNAISFDFLGINLSAVPTWRVWTIDSLASLGLTLIPVISALSQWFSMWLTQKFNNSVTTNEKGEKDEAAAAATNSTMKTMNIMMPVMSLWIGFSMPAGMSVYWITQGFASVIQEFFLTKHYRKVYDAEDEIRRQQAAEEAERARIRAEKRAKMGDVADPNTSKKKIAAKEKAEREALGVVEGKLTSEEREALRRQREEEQEKKSFSGIEDRPFCRGRSYKPTRYGRDTSGGTGEIYEEDVSPDAQAAPETAED